MSILSLFPSTNAQQSSGGANPSYFKQFAVGDWVTGVSEKTLSIPESSHELSGDVVDYQVLSQHYGVYVKDTWAAAQTYASKESDGSITLHSPAAFDGCVVLTAYAANS